MKLAAVITFLTAFFSIAVKVVGMPDQIKNNYRRKSTAGLSAWFMLSTLISYGLWVVHGIQIHDMALIVGQGLGTLVTAVIVTQMFLYRKNQPQPSNASRPTLLWYSALLTKVSLRKHTKKR
jgi:uncharacterized protein with PQ loop repeat